MEKFDNEDLRKELAANGIESRNVWRPMHLQPFFKNYLFFGMDVAEKLHASGLCLPSGSNMTSEDKNQIKNVLCQYFEKFK